MLGSCFWTRNLFASRHLVFSSPRRLASSFDSNSSSFPESPDPYFYTKEQDPRKHDQSHLGRLYRIPETIVEPPAAEASLSGRSVRRLNFFPTQYTERCEALGESTLLIRQPALEILDVMRQVEPSKLKRPLKFVLWGKPGQGKSLTLAHVHHFLRNSPDIIVLHFGLMKKWLHRNLELAESTHSPGLWDHLGDSHLLLIHFLEHNQGKLEGLNTHKTYVWSTREQTEAGSPLIDLVKQGINRPIFAADCINAVMRELKLHAIAGGEQREGGRRIRVAVLIDGINAIFNRMSLVNKEISEFKGKMFTRKYMEGLLPVDKFTVIRQLKKMLGNDCSDVIVVGTADKTVQLDNRGRVQRNKWWFPLNKRMVPDKDPDYPFSLLGQEGWETLDPFIPIEVPKFDEGELDIMIDYYVDKGYIRQVAASENGRKEIKFLSGGNGKDFMEFSNMW